MIIYNLLLNISEVLIISYFVFAYFSLSRKSLYLLVPALFISCEFCDIIRQNGSVLNFLYLVISYAFILFKKKKIIFTDLFILIFYLFFSNFIPIFTYSFFRLFLPVSILFNLCVGITSKIILFLFTYLFIKKFKKDLIIPNKQYLLIIFSEFIIFFIFNKISYSIVDTSTSFNPLTVSVLLTATFLAILINGIYLNHIYNEKLSYQKQLQKEKQIQQNLSLIKDIQYNIEKKEHQMYWILEKIKRIDDNKEIHDIIDNYRKKNKDKHIIQSKNPIFDAMISLKLNELIKDNIIIKPQFTLDDKEDNDNLEFINSIIHILNHIKENTNVSFIIKNKGMYSLVELYSLQDFYRYEDYKPDTKMVTKYHHFCQNNIYIVKFVLEKDI